MATRAIIPTVLALSSIAVSLGLTRNATTYLHELPNGKKLVCNQCPPGSHLLRHCTETQRTLCRPCSAGFFTEYWNYISDCLPCSWCSTDQVVTQECTGSSNRVCACKEGFYWDSYMCTPHTVCPSGHGVKVQGTSERDAVCEPCKDGYYASRDVGNTRCVPHTECKSEEKLLFRGNTCVDNVCGTCNEIANNGDWVKLIDQPFVEIFKDHTSRKLNRFIKQLTNSKESRAIRSEMDHNRMYQKLQQWISEATEQEILNLPKHLQERGLKNLATKIEHRIKRIQNEVNMCKNDLF